MTLIFWLSLGVVMAALCGYGLLWIVLAAVLPGRARAAERPQKAETE